MMQTHFVSDCHFAHKRIVEFTNRGKDTTQENHDEWLINLWNNQVTKQDKIYSLGDFSFSHKYEEVEAVVRRLNGQKFFLKGNHCDNKIMQKLAEKQLITFYDYKEIKIGKHPVCLFHFPISAWHKQAYGSWHLHGHCVDDATEILTSNGWKFRNQIKEQDTVISYNIDSGYLENDSIQNIIDLDYSGEVIVGNGKSYDFRFTSEHTDLIRKSSLGPVTKVKANELISRGKSWMIVSGINKENKGTGLTLDELKLYIILAADGSIKDETNLCRVRIKKNHKIDYITNLLRSLNIKYNLYESKGYLSFNFYLPRNLYDINIKGLDNLLLKATIEEADAIFEAYSNSDGHQSGNTLIIYSAKEQEIDLLQSMFCQNGFMTNKYSRYHGFGNKLQHQLSVSKKQEQTFKGSDLTTEQVLEEHFWCVVTNNRTWIMRRNGVVKITGNCHGNYNPPTGKILDVGLDSAYNIYGEHRFFTEQDIESYMVNREVNVVDHHKDRTGEYK